MQNRKYECDKYKEQLFDYVSDILTDEERAAVELHIGSCAECAKELDEIRAILGAAAELAEPEIPVGLRESVSERIKCEESAVRFKKRRFARAIQFSIPLAACAVLAIGIYSGGLYDKYMKADNMLSMGETVIRTEETLVVDNIDNSQETETPSTDIVETPQRKYNENEKNTAVKENAAEQTGETTVPAPVAERAEEAVPAVENAEEAAAENAEESANIPMAASEVDDTAKYSVARSIETDMAIPEGAEETGGAAGGAVSGAGSSKLKAEKADNPPASCIIITDDPEAFAKGFGKELTDGEFVLSHEEWNAFTEYVRGYGAQLDADFTDEYNGQTLVTVKK